MSSDPYTVEVWVYDLSNGMAKAMSPMLLGRQIEAIYHTGIVVYGTEYFFGGGIASSRPGATQAGQPIRKVKLGKTDITQDQFHAWLHSVGNLYTAATYDLLTNNCNNFAAEVAKFLLTNNKTAKPFPQEILDLPKIVLATPMGQAFKPMLAQMGPNSQNNSNAPGFIPVGQAHLDLPTSKYNDPPTFAATTTTTTTTTTPTSPTPASPKPPAEVTLDWHRITSLTDLADLKYQTIQQIPIEPPSTAIITEAANITKMTTLLKASYKNPKIKTNFDTFIALDKANNTAALDAAQTAVSDAVANIINCTKGVEGAKHLEVKEYLGAIQALYFLTTHYNDTQSILGNVGVMNVLLSTLYTHCILFQQKDAEHFKDEDKTIFAMCSPLLTQSAPNALAFETYLDKLIEIYQRDVIPFVLTGTSTINNAVLRLLKQQIESTFYLYIQFNLSAPSALSILKLIQTLTTAEAPQDIGGPFIPTEIDVILEQQQQQQQDEATTMLQKHKNRQQLSQLGYNMFVFYISLLKTDYSVRPPVFSMAQNVNTGITYQQLDKTPDVTGNAKVVEVVMELLVAYILTSNDMYTHVIEKFQEAQHSTGAVAEFLLSLFQNNILHQLYIVGYILAGNQEYCKLYQSLEYALHETPNTRFNAMSKRFNKVLPYDLLQQFAKLLVDIDAIMTIGTRERFW